MKALRQGRHWVWGLAHCHTIQLYNFKKLEINYFKILTISFIIIFKWNYAINYGQTEVQKCIMYQRNLLYLAECQWDISDLQLVRNKGNQY